MAEAIKTLAALGSMLALADIVLAEGTGKRSVFFVGALLTAGTVIRLCLPLMRWLDIA